MNKACTPVLRAHPIKKKDNNTGMSDAFLGSVFYPTSSEQSTCTTKVTWGKRSVLGNPEECIVSVLFIPLVSFRLFYSYRWFHLDCFIHTAGFI